MACNFTFHWNQKGMYIFESEVLRNLDGRIGSFYQV